MEKKKIIIVIGIIILTILGILSFILLNRKYPYEDENTLYFKEFNNTILRLERVDYSLGQNQVVIVQKSTNKGKSFEDITKEPIILSMEPKITFLNEKLGFVLAKSNLTKNNNYLGLYITKDGGKTFENCKINYNNSNIEMLTIVSTPFYDNDILKMKASIYIVKEDQNGYENKKLIFISDDKGLSWKMEK